MGLFNKKDKASSVIFIGESLQPIGKIPLGVNVGLSLKPEQQVLVIHYDKTDITLPYSRIRGFRLADETTLAKNGNTVGRAIIGGAIAGTTGALVGGMSAKGNTKTKWIGTLIYEDKEGNIQELNFIQWGLSGYYDGKTKHYGASQFENLVNKIAYNSGDDITEL